MMSGSLVQNSIMERPHFYAESQMKQLTSTKNLIPITEAGKQDQNGQDNVMVKKSESVVTLYTSKNVQSPQKLVEQLAREKGFMNSPIIIVENISKVTSASPMTSTTLSNVQSPPNLYVSMPTPDSSVQTSQSASSQEVHKCEECDYSSHNKHYLKQHVDLVHCANRPYKCPFCNYAGKRSHSLREHLLVHSNERPFVCIHCHATFRKKGHLTNHSKLHQNMVTCPICKISISQPDVESHMKSVHQIDRLYVCDVCNFMAVNKSEIEDHMKMHDTPFSKIFVCEMCNHKSKTFEEFCVHAESHRASIGAPKDKEKPIQAKNDKTQNALADRKMMKCSECGFVSGIIGQMKDHMLMHINEEKNGGKPVEEAPKANTEQTKVATIPGDKAAYNCVECEFSCSEAYVFVVHMLTHRPDLQISGDKAMTESSVQQKPEHVHPQVMNEMVMQKEKQAKKQIPITTTITELPKATTTEVSQSIASTTTNVNSSSANPSSQVAIPVIGTNSKPDVSKYLGTTLSSQSLVTNSPVTNTDQEPSNVDVNSKNQNSENPPFVYNSASSKYKCTVCGYTCDYQRTIKAHIWKHSGNKDIDYPMFQNGPLSIYEGSSLAEAEKPVTNQSSTILVSEVQKHQSVVTAQTCSTDKIQQQVNKTSVSPVAPVLANMLAMRAKQKDPNGEFEIISMEQQPMTSIDRPVCSGPPPLLQLAPVTKDGTMVVSVCIDSIQSNTYKDSTAQASNDTVMLMFPDGTSESSALAKRQDNSERNLASPSYTYHKESTIKTETPKATIVTVKRDILDSNEPDSKTYERHLKRKVGIDEISQRPPKQKRIGETQNVVVETVDNSNVTSFTGMKSQQNSPRAVSEISQSELSDSGIGSDTNTVVAATVELNSITESRQDVTTRDSSIFQDFGNEVVVSSTSSYIEDTAEIDTESDTESNVSDEDLSEEEEITVPKRKRMPSTSMTEAVTLLSLLKKGPNQNPACPVTTSTNDAIESEEKPKQGISSSLLAVIEQLRERSKTEAELEELTGITATKKSGRKRIKRETLDDNSEIEKIDNVERIEEEGESRLRCKFCHYSSVNTVIIRQHMRLHKTKQPFECSLCDFIATSSESLQDHMIQHCKVRTYQCKLCASAFNYKSQLRAHMRAHTEKEVYVCDDCDYETTNPVSYRNHVRGHTEKKQYKCEVCDKKFISKCELKSHKKLLCSNQISFQCDECDFLAIGPQEQRQHAKIHNKEFKCAKCEYTTTSITRFENHAKIHDEPKTLKCELCDFPAVSNRSLKSHMKRHINDQRFVQQPLEQYKCNICGYVCHHLPSLKSHMWRHASDQNYSYEFTNEVINAAIDYDSRLDSYECQKDDIRVFFATIRQKLKDRLEGMNAPGDAQSAACWVTFRCCQCGFETINKAELNVHMKSHSDIIKWTLQVNDKQKKEKV